MNKVAESPITIVGDPLGPLSLTQKRVGGALHRLLLSLVLAILMSTVAAAAPLCGRVGQPPCPPPDRNVLTQHNDPQRTGAYLAETLLTPATVGSSDLGNLFGRLYARKVKGFGFIVSQPLYVENINNQNLVIVATSKNHVYAFDAQSADPDPSAGLVWDVQLPDTAELPSQFGALAGPPGKRTFIYSCPTTVWKVGVTSTPVIDISTTKHI